jgi:excisionase family DNA binding protein
MMAPEDTEAPQPVGRRPFGDEEEYLRVADVAKAFHVSPKTVSRWADEGRLPHITTLGGHRRFPRKAIEALLPGQQHDQREG